MEHLSKMSHLSVYTPFIVAKVVTFDGGKGGQGKRPNGLI